MRTAPSPTPTTTTSTAEDPAAALRRRFGSIEKAAESGSVDGVRAFLDGGASLSGQPYRPLWVAAERGHLDVVRLLVERGADIGAGKQYRTDDVWDGTLLHDAAAKGNEPLVRALLVRPGLVDARMGSGNTPLHLAAHRGHPGVVRTLLERGAAVGATNDHAHTPLHRAVWWLAGDAAGHREVVRLLLDRGADIRALDKEGNRPIHRANPYNPRHADTFEAVVRLLIERGADVREPVQSQFPTTLLHKAAASASPATIRFLVSQGIGADAPGTFGVTPLYETVKNACSQICLRANVGAMRTLIELGADVNRRQRVAGSNCCTPLNAAAAAIENGEEAVRLLLDRGARVNGLADQANAGDGVWSPLFGAARWRVPATARVLIARGATVDLGRPATGDTPLHEAMRHERGDPTAIVRVLLDAGANVNARNKAGKTPLAVARPEFAEAIALLKQHGAQP